MKVSTDVHRNAALVLPLLLVNTAAIYGQSGWAHDHLGHHWIAVEAPDDPQEVRGRRHAQPIDGEPVSIERVEAGHRVQDEHGVHDRAGGEDHRE